MQEIKLPCHTGLISKASCVSKRLISTHFSSCFQWQDMIYDVNIVDFITQYSKLSDNPHHFQQTFNLSSQQTNKLKDKLTNHTLQESLKEKAFIDVLHEDLIPISNVSSIAPKNSNELLEQHNYVVLSHTYASVIFIQAKTAEIKANVHKYGFVKSNLEFSDFESICKLSDISLVSHNDHYFHPEFYQDCVYFCKFAPICHQLDPLSILEKRQIPFKPQNKSTLGNKSSSVITLSFYYLTEILKLNAKPGLFQKGTNDKLMHLLLRGVQQDYLLPILRLDNVPDYDKLAELVQEPVAELKIKEILNILNKMQLQLNNEEFNRYLKALIYMQWDRSVSDVTCFHLMTNWEFIKMESSVYIRAIDIPEIVKYMTEDIQLKCNKLMQTGQLEERREQEEAINYFY